MNIECCDRKLQKFIDRLQSLTEILHKESTNLYIHQAIDDFYYMQKIAELTFLREMLCLSSMNQESIIAIIEVKFKDVFFRWKREVRWLNRFLISNKNNSVITMSAKQSEFSNSNPNFQD